jgi:hypothetical protein
MDAATGLAAAMALVDAEADTPARTGAAGDRWPAPVEVDTEVDAEARTAGAEAAAPRADVPGVTLTAEAVDPSAAADVDSEFSHPSGATGSTKVETGVPARSNAGRFE